MARVRYSFSSRRTGHLENMRKQREKFPSVVLEVVRISDIILEVLDARFIEETRNLELEKLVKENGKKIIYVLNKADLVDGKKVKKQVEEKNLFPFVFVSSKNRKGASDLRSRIKIEVSRLPEGDHFARAQVGIVGYPNTGKSSLINVLTGKPAAKTSQQAGFTKGMQKIRLSEDILILDTPGVIPSKEYSHSKKELVAKHAKVGSRTYDSVRDPEFAVYKIFEEHPNSLQNFYKIETENFDELLEDIGKEKKFLKKGGKVDTDRAARAVLKEWQEGKIKI